MKTYQRICTIEALTLFLALAMVGTAMGAGVVGANPATTVTATMDNGNALNSSGSLYGNTWYEVGVNPAALTSGLQTGLVAGQTDPLSTYLIQPATGNNALMLDSSKKTATLTFSKPFSITAVSLAGSSGNGSGTLTPTLHFTDGTTDTLSPVTAGDWFNFGSNRVETAKGRIDVGSNTFDTQSALSDNPRIYALNETLSAADANKTVYAIDLSWTGSGANTHTAIFGLSADFTGLGHFSAVPLDPGSFNRDIIVGLQEIPEPSTIALLGLGILGMVACYRRRSAS